MTPAGFTILYDDLLVTSELTDVLIMTDGSM